MSHSEIRTTAIDHFRTAFSTVKTIQNESTGTIFPDTPIDLNNFIFFLGKSQFRIYHCLYLHSEVKIQLKHQMSIEIYLIISIQNST